MIEDERREKSECRRQVNDVKRSMRGPNNRALFVSGLRACRLARGLAQRDLAALIATNQATIHALESEEWGAYPKTIRKLCAALRVEPVDLLTAEANEEE